MLLWKPSLFADMTTLARIQQDAGQHYRNFLGTTADSESVGDFVLLYGQSMIDERNQTYELEQYLPGWFTIGDDSGGIALLMKLDGTDGVYQCGHGAIGSLEPQLVATSFREWHDNECPTPWNED